MTVTDNVILGEDCIYSTDCNKTGLNNNIVVCGASGTGKTMSITEPRLLETKNTSLIVTVTKRRIVNKYEAMFRERGYNVLDLNFINPAGSNICYDPLAYVSNYSDITFLAESVVKSNPRKSKYTNADPYWDDAAISLLSAEIAYILATKSNPSFVDVLELHDSITFDERGDTIRTSLDGKFDRIAEKNPSSFAVSCWKSFKQLPIKTASCVFSTLNTTMDTLFSPALRKMMRKGRIDFKQIANEKTVLFVSTSAVNPALNCFVNIFYGQLFKQLFEYAESRPDGRLPIPVHVLCDDFATGSKIMNFSEYISVFREKALSVTLLLQSESQLESLYGSEQSTTILNNCDTYIYLGGMDLKTAQNISLRTNKPLDEILYMPVGKEIIFRRGQPPIHTSRFKIEQNQLYRRITRQYENKILSSGR